MEGKEKERKGEIHQCMVGCSLSAPYWGPGPQPRHVSWLGIKLVTLWFAGQCSIHRATPARAHALRFKNTFPILTSSTELESKREAGSPEPGNGADVFHSPLLPKPCMLTGYIVHKCSCLLASPAPQVTPYLFLTTLAPSSLSFLLTLCLF